MSDATVARVKEVYGLARRGDPRRLLDFVQSDASWEGVAGMRWKACETGNEVVEALLWRGAVHRLRATEVVDVGDRVIVGLAGTRMNRLGAPWWGRRIFQLVTVRDGKISHIQDFGRRDQALAAAGLKV